MALVLSVKRNEVVKIGDSYIKYQRNLGAHSITLVIEGKEPVTRIGQVEDLMEHLKNQPDHESTNKGEKKC